MNNTFFLDHRSTILFQDEVNAQVDDSKEDNRIMAEALGEEILFEKGINPPSWVKNEDIWNRAKKAVEKAYGTISGKYGVVTHVYRKMGGKVG